MLIKGEKVLLRAIEYSDAELLRRMINDQEIEEMMWGESFPISVHQQEIWIENLSKDHSAFRAMIDWSGTTVGEIMLTSLDMRNGHGEIHIKLADKDLRGKGIGTDAVQALTAYAFQYLRLYCLYCRVHEKNTASQRMFAKCGYQRDGVLRSRIFKNGKFWNFYEYSILALEWKEGNRGAGN